MTCVAARHGRGRGCWLRLLLLLLLLQLLWGRVGSGLRVVMGRGGLLRIAIGGHRQGCGLLLLLLRGWVGSGLRVAGGRRGLRRVAVVCGHRHGRWLRLLRLLHHHHRRPAARCRPDVPWQHRQLCGAAQIGCKGARAADHRLDLVGHAGPHAAAHTGGAEGPVAGLEGTAGLGVCGQVESGKAPLVVARLCHFLGLPAVQLLAVLVEHRLNLPRLGAHVRVHVGVAMVVVVVSVAVVMVVVPVVMVVVMSMMVVVMVVAVVVVHVCYHNILLDVRHLHTLDLREDSVWVRRGENTVRWCVWWICGSFAQLCTCNTLAGAAAVPFLPCPCRRVLPWCPP